MSNCKFVKRFSLSGAAIVFFVQSALAQDWPQWRGPDRDGLASGFAAPKTWPGYLKSKWKVTVGLGHSSPVVVGKRLYLHSRRGENEVVAAYNLDAGHVIWQDIYPAEYSMNPAATGHGKGPKSTPVHHDGKLYTLGITGVLSAYESANGKLLWRKESLNLFKAKAPLFGTSTSPVVDRGLVIVFMGGNDSGALVAFDANTGAEKWRWSGDGPGYASPIVVEIAGKRQIVTQSQKNIIGVWADNGALLWQIPFETEYVQNIVTPVQYKDLLIFSGINKGVFAVRVGWRDNKWITDTVWQNKEVSMYMNSPIVHREMVFGMSHRNKGQFFCLDANTGKTLWTGDPRQGENAAMIIANDLLFSLTNDADLIVAKASDKAATAVRKYRVADSPTWAHPAIVGKHVLIKDENSLAMLSFE
jgi:outer membrane protein assembly factor BamB